MNKPLPNITERTIILDGGPHHGKTFQVIHHDTRLLDIPMEGWWSDTWSRYNVFSTSGTYLGEVE